MNTLFMLMAQYEKATIDLDIVAEEYLKLSPEQAKRKAAVADLPLPVFRTGTQKGAWKVHLEDLAAYLDAQRAEATRLQRAMAATAS